MAPRGTWYGPRSIHLTYSCSNSMPQIMALRYFLYEIIFTRHYVHIISSFPPKKLKKKINSWSIILLSLILRKLTSSLWQATRTWLKLSNCEEHWCTSKVSRNQGETTSNLLVMLLHGLDRWTSKVIPLRENYHLFKSLYTSKIEQCYPSTMYNLSIRSR